MKKGIIAVLFLMIFIMVGCDKKNAPVQEQENAYKIYYIDGKTLEIVSETYEAAYTSEKLLVEELFEQLKSDPSNRVYRKAVPEAIKLLGIDFMDRGSLTLDLDSSYSALSGIGEVLCRAAIVKTLCQIPGVEYVKFTVAGQPLIDSAGAQIGLMTKGDFIEETGTDMSYKVVLYFADEEGKALIPKNSIIYYTGSGSIEEMVVNQLINGRTETGIQNTIPAGTTLLNITTRENICYIDFNEKFLEAMPGITDAVTIYSIVNSLVELPNINKVQFLINSSLKETFRDSKNFDGFFERNLEIIQEGNR